MQVVRLYTGDDGESHFEEIDLPYEKVAEADARRSRTPRISTSADTSPAISSTGTWPRAASM